MENKQRPQTLQQAIRHYSDEDVCIFEFAAMRWPKGIPVCPHCNGREHYYLKTQRRWKCKVCRKQFSVKVGTIFEDSPLGLEKWMTAAWMLANCKNGISSYEVASALGITQKSAWFMMHRIRLAMQTGSFMKMGGGGREVEVDETFIGGKARNMHLDKRQRRITGTGGKDKTAVIGILERGGKIRVGVVPNRRKSALQSEVKKHVLSGTAVYSVEPFHLFRYLDEQAFRYNNRKDMTTADRFSEVMANAAGRRLTYAELTGKIGTTPV